MALSRYSMNRGLKTNRSSEQRKDQGKARAEVLPPWGGGEGGVSLTKCDHRGSMDRFMVIPTSQGAF